MGLYAVLGVWVIVRGRCLGPKFGFMIWVGLWKDGGGLWIGGPDGLGIAFFIIIIFFCLCLSVGRESSRGLLVGLRIVKFGFCLTWLLLTGQSVHTVTTLDECEIDCI